jgi:hypothetical protein
MCISKRIKWILKKSHRENFFFCIFFQFTHQVGMKNNVECYKEFFGYFNVLETNSVVGFRNLEAVSRHERQLPENRGSCKTWNTILPELEKKSLIHFSRSSGISKNLPLAVLCIDHTAKPCYNLIRIDGLHRKLFSLRLRFFIFFSLTENLSQSISTVFVIFWKSCPLVWCTLLKNKNLYGCCRLQNWICIYALYE